MEADSWNHLSASSTRQQNARQSRFDPYMGFEEVDSVEDDTRVEFPCPFCSEDFDIVGLCCHIDEEHPAEARNVECPICESTISMDMIGHIMQHGNFFKMQRRRRFRRGPSGSSSSLSLLKRELRDAHLQSLLSGSSYPFSSNSSADPILSSFISNFPVADSSKEDQPHKLDEVSLTSEQLDDKTVERVEASLSDQDLKERSQRSEFLRDLLLSTIFDDVL